MNKRNVILVTDGDEIARSAVELASHNIGGRCISASGGNPTPLNGHEIVRLIKKAEHDPVIVMADDRGRKGIGKGERAMKIILNHKDIRVLGVVAVSSNGKDCKGLKVSCSITKDGSVIEAAVDKFGNNIGKNDICGDTLSILGDNPNLIIVGIRDPGKMDFYDEILKGSPITTKALKEVIKRSGYK
jgi:stage V sporulation protein AE